MSSEIIRVENLSKMYSTREGDFHALDKLSFAIEEGGFVSIVGPSGCGKSTLLQLLTGLLEPTSGQVLIDGVEVRGPLPEKTGVMFQDATLLPWLTAEENVAFPLSLCGADRDESQRRSRDLLKLVGLGDFINHRPAELSGGMRQRVAIARGLVRDPRILLMDEPFAALDEQTRFKMGEELLWIWQETRKTILFITHGLTEAIYLSDTVLVMGSKPGRIVDVIPVDLPRPRTFEMISSEVFGQARNRIWKLIQEGAEA